MNTKEKVRTEVGKFIRRHVEKKGGPPQNSRKMCEKIGESYETFKTIYPCGLKEAIKDATNN